MLEKANRAIVDRMIEACQERLVKVAGAADCVPGKYGCTVLLTAQGSLYAEAYTMDNETERAAEERLLAQMYHKGETEVAYVFCMPGGVPPCWLVELLPRLHPRNLEARVILSRRDPRYRTIQEFQPLQK